jgi:hypothetical protein
MNLKKTLEPILKSAEASIVFFGTIVLLLFSGWFNFYYRSQYLHCIESTKN